MAGLRRSCAAVALVVAAVVLVACTASVTGRAVRAAGRSPAPILARDVLLHDGDRTPLGPAVATKVGDNYFTSARPPECSAALLFRGSPLRPPGSSDFAESAYRVDGPALYAESVDVYNNSLNPHDVVWNGFRAVSRCHGEATPVSPSGAFAPMQLGGFAITEDGVLSWTMTHPNWTCNYGLAVVPQVALLISACDSKPGFPMAEWAAKRKAQIDART
ncbi:Putative lipoprotein LprH [Mycobacterium simulans]|uniref:Lipoprotein LprH n=1 Tax=Mycobacterium simulans TaxID=627089 RepID=A0A7Z7IK97_9MYCO|nr:hypothetical protein [Mycobacterium simulans]SOJ54823.1 Putative lipoprotein LprH [Mycobacterium simulans]